MSESYIKYTVRYRRRKRGREKASIEIHTGSFTHQMIFKPCSEDYYDIKVTATIKRGFLCSHCLSLRTLFVIKISFPISINFDLQALSWISTQNDKSRVRILVEFIAFTYSKNFWECMYLTHLPQLWVKYMWSETSLTNGENWIEAIKATSLLGMVRL